MTTNTVAFPTVPSIPAPNTSYLTDTQSNALVISHHNAALEICDLVYGSGTLSWEAIERFYEPSATYENPLVTATSRAVIADIHTLATHLAQIDVPKPAALLFALFGMERSGRWKDPWFRALKVWSEVSDVSESDSFDGHRKTIVEHTLHILLLPGLHSAASQPPIITSPQRSVAMSDLSISHYSTVTQSSNIHSTLGLDLSLPSPLHLRLPIITRLLFNDVGRITHHRDFWDVKDLLGLVPGMTVTQWITGRIFAQGIRGAVGIGRSLLGPSKTPTTSSSQSLGDEEEGLTPAEAYVKSVKGGHHRLPGH